MRPCLALLAVLSLSSAPAFAVTDTSHASRAESSKPAADSSPGAERKFCITPDKMTTGSRLYIRECLTKAEWARRGIEVDEDSKQQ